MGKGEGRGGGSCWLFELVGKWKGVDESTYDIKKSSSRTDILHHQPPLFIRSAYEPRMH
jgi:hypothetical protein